MTVIFIEGKEISSGTPGHLTCETLPVTRHIDLEVFIHVPEYIVWEGLDVHGDGASGCVK